MADRREELETEIENAWEGHLEAKYEGYHKIAAAYKKQVKRLKKEYNSLTRGLK